MNRNYLYWLAASAIILIAIPLLLIGPLGSECGIGISFILLLVVNPVFFVLVGGIAGRNLKLWALLPLAAAVMSILGMWGGFSGFGTFATDYLIYALAYLMVGYMSMLVSWLAGIRRERRDEMHRNDRMLGR